MSEKAGAEEDAAIIGLGGRGRRQVDAVRAGIEAFAGAIDTAADYPTADARIIPNAAVPRAIVRSARSGLPEPVSRRPSGRYWGR